jgi:hypothetical protein
MTRRPDADETIILGTCSGWKGGERFYIADLALYLHTSTNAIRRWGRKQQLMKRLVLKCRGYGAVEYFTRYGALRVIAHFRALQGEDYLRGRDYHRNKEVKTEWFKRKRARLSK